MNCTVFIFTLAAIRYQKYFVVPWIKIDASAWGSVKVTRKIIDEAQMSLEVKITVYNDAKAVKFLKEKVFCMNGLLGPAISNTLQEMGPSFDGLKYFLTFSIITT